MKKRLVQMIVLSAAFGAGMATAAAQKAANPHIMMTAGDVAWGAAPPFLMPGAKFAVVSGDPGASGPFAIRLQLPAGYRISPHWHSTDEHVTVISGVLGLGMGDTFDAKSTKDLPAGGYAVLPAQMHHFAAAKSDAVVQIHGTGPFVVNYVNAADDPTQKKK